MFSKRARNISKSEAYPEHPGTSKTESFVEVFVLMNTLGFSRFFELTLNANEYFCD